MRRRWKKRLLGGLLVVLAIAFVGTIVSFRTLYPLRYEETIDFYAEEYGLSAALLCGVIHSESRFQPDAVSKIGARGLMQITEETFEWAKWRMGDTKTTYADLFLPEVNIRYGGFILKLLLEEFENEAAGLAAYHAGWGCVKNWLANPQHSSDGTTLSHIPYRDTAHYVPTVQKAAQIYRRFYHKT